MALTDAGRQLTEEHRLAQLAIGANAAILSGELWDMLDPNDLDGTRRAWVASSVIAAQLQFGQSRSLAETYVSSYQAMEAPSGDSVLVVPSFDPGKVSKDLDLAGPQYIKSLIREGQSPQQAHLNAQTRMAGVTRKHAMDGGRGLIDSTTAQDRRAIGYRRVTDGDPCTFCAMLASRGAYFGTQRSHSLYTSETTALLRESDGLKYHLHCGCTAEIVYDSWQPTQAEQVYVDAYERAIGTLDGSGRSRTQSNVLSLMRADERANFRDGHHRRRNSPETD